MTERHDDDTAKILDPEHNTMETGIGLPAHTRQVVVHEYDPSGDLLERLRGLLTAPPVDWREWVDDLRPEIRRELVKDLDALLDRAALLQGYVDGRANATGIGDEPHRYAVRRGNRVRAQVRTAIGFAMTPTLDF